MDQVGPRGGGTGRPQVHEDGRQGEVKTKDQVLRLDRCSVRRWERLQSPKRDTYNPGPRAGGVPRQEEVRTVVLPTIKTTHVAVLCRQLKDINK